MKRMYTCCMLLCLSLCSIAQNNSSGVYLTEEDFNNNKLSHASDKIIFHEFIEKPFITVKEDGKKTLLFKIEIFAYQKKGRIVRTSNFVPYTLLEKGNIWIYYKDANTADGKGFRMGRKYFYSLSGKDEIIPLTIHNLKRSFPSKHLFHNFLDAHFRTDAELSLYDKLNKKFKVNHLLQTTVFESASRPGAVQATI